MVKLTRLNHEVIVVNADHLSFIEACPDTTITLITGERILVRESLEEVIERVIEFRRLVRMMDPLTASPVEGEHVTVTGMPRRHSDFPTRRSLPVRGER